MKLCSSTLTALALSTLPLVARAEAPAEAPPPAATPAAPAAQKAPAPPPYSLPWQLRPAAILSVIRSDTSIATYTDPATKQGTHTVASLITAIYKLTPDFAPFVRIAVVGTEKSGGMANPAFGGTYMFKPMKNLRVASFLGFALPAGEGGGNTKSPLPGNAVRAGVLARAAMDNALFAINDFTIFPGVGVAWVDHGLTIQAEATVLFLMRARGDEVQKDKSKVNFTSGLHVGYFIAPWISAGAELRYQRWLSTPAAVAADTTGALRDTLSFAIGPRGHIKLGESTWLRPGISYGRGLDKPMSGADYNIVQIDVPLFF